MIPVSSKGISVKSTFFFNMIANNKKGLLWNQLMLCKETDLYLSHNPNFIYVNILGLEKKALPKIRGESHFATRYIICSAQKKDDCGSALKCFVNLRNQNKEIPVLFLISLNIGMPHIFFHIPGRIFFSLSIFLLFIR